MTSSLVRGMPYATMIYPNFSDGNIIPTIYAERTIISPIKLDGGNSTATCIEGSTFKANKDLELHFETGLTWLVFFSHPVTFQCKENTTGTFMLQASSFSDQASENPFTLRLAMVFEDGDDDNIFEEEYKELLRSHSNVYPGRATHVEYEINDDDAALIFEWDPQPLNGNQNEMPELIMFAMPHHQEKLDGLGNYCATAMLGSVCVVEGSTWSINEALPPISFGAPRLPDAAMIPDLAEAVTHDLSFRIPENFLRGAGDTYFSGKALGKLARILLIAEEILEMCTRRRRSIV